MVTRPLSPLLLLVLLPIAVPGLLADSPPSQVGPADPQPPCSVTGVVTAGRFRLPGVVITATPRSGGPTVATSTGLDGVFTLALPAGGRYDVKAELAAFATLAAEVTTETTCQARLDLAMTLASRAAAADRPAAPPAGASRPQGEAAQRPAPGQYQRVGAAGTHAPQGQPEPLMSSVDDARALAEHLNLPPGFSPETLGETVTAFGRTGQTNDMLLFGPGGEGLFGRPEGAPGLPGTGGEQEAAGGAGAAGLPGGRGGEAGGGFGGGRGGGLGGGGMRGGPMGGGGQRGGPGALGDRLALANRMRQDQPHGQASYTFGGSPLDAAPYSLNGRDVPKPTYTQHRFAGSVGGQFKVPRLFDLGSRTSYFLSYSGNRSSNLHAAYSTVPSALQRAGDFSSSSAQLVDPSSGLPFTDNRIPATRLDPSALSLLQFIPLPNQPGDSRNYYYSTTTSTSADDVNFRLVRTFGTPTRRGGRGAMGGGPMGGPGGGRGGGPGGGTNLNVAIHYRRQESTQAAAFPALSGRATQTGWDVPIGFSFSLLGVQHSLRAQFNRNDTATTNAFAGVRDVAGEAGISGVSSDPFDWGVPALTFSGFSSLRDITPSARRAQTFTFSDSMSRMYRRHNLRWGLDFKDERLDSRTDASARGAYVFTGLFTGGGTARLSGADLADFLLGMPQQASIQFGPGLERFRSQSVDGFFQDDWRVSANFTINAGLRYEYQAPYSEAGNRLANLDVASEFTAAVPVLAGEVGQFTGRYPVTIVEADRNNVSPRIGLAWRPRPKTVIRGGYGINYSSVPYLSIAQKLAGQPPFASTDTRIGTVEAPLPLSRAFAEASSATTRNNFGVDRNYRIGFVHLWNADIQREINRTLSVGVGYTGTKGLSLDILRAPNRGPTGTTINGVQPFIWESSGGESILHSASLRLRKRLAQGVALGGTYTYSKSRDNASSLGGGGGVVAQNDKDLAAEWGLSSFDVRHRFSGDFSLELPFGPNRRWLNREGVASQFVGGWMMNGTISIASGQPFTARVTGAVSDVAGGVNGTLRANYDGTPIVVDAPTILQFFNAAAFSVPAVGTFGNAGRNTIIGPGSTTFNMGLMKNFAVRGTRGLSVRIQASNVLNVPVWGSIDTTVNSPTFGQVTSVRSMRSVQIALRTSF